MPPECGLGKDRLEQRYSNQLEVGFNPLEFVLRFAQANAGEKELQVASVVTSPAFAKAFSRTLAEAVGRFEERFGEIPGTEDPAHHHGE